MKVKADFYKATITKGDYQEDVKTWAQQFSTGVTTKTVTFKDKLAAQQNVTDEAILVYCRKNPNTQSVQTGWHVAFNALQGSPRYVVTGIDANIGNRAEIIFHCERVKDGTV